MTSEDFKEGWQEFSNLKSYSNSLALSFFKQIHKTPPWIILEDEILDNHIRITFYCATLDHYVYKTYPLDWVFESVSEQHRLFQLAHNVEIWNIKIESYLSAEREMIAEEDDIKRDRSKTSWLKRASCKENIQWNTKQWNTKQ